jgi:hypothetical protein
MRVPGRCFALPFVRARVPGFKAAGRTGVVLIRDIKANRKISVRRPKVFRMAEETPRPSEATHLRLWFANYRDMTRGRTSRYTVFTLKALIAVD